MPPPGWLIMMPGGGDNKKALFFLLFIMTMKTRAFLLASPAVLSSFIMIGLGCKVMIMN